jgi:oligopeptide/dipeptide ABC transporter ATP-binding protein
VLRTPVGASAAALLGAVLLLAVLAPILWSARANAIDTSEILKGPSSAHWLGTDDLGRDIFYRVLVATRLSVELALIATAIGVGAGLLLGTAPLVLGRSAGRLVTAVVNIAVAFPALLLALFFAVIFGVGEKGALLAIGFAGAPSFARLTQTLVAGVENLDYVAAARIAGVGRIRVLLRHVLPNVGEPLVVNATIGAGSALLSFAGLSFLGLGVQAPAYDWGQLLSNGLDGIYEHPAAALAPGIAVVVAGLAFNMFGEAVAKGLGVPTLSYRIRRGQRLTAPELAAAAGLATGMQDAAAPRPDETEGEDALVLAVQDLRVTFPGPDGPVTPVRGVSLALHRGEAVGVVGESGSGKTLTALAVARLIEEPGRVQAGRLQFLGYDLRTSAGQVQRQLLGTSFGMVFQDPVTSFNPTQKIGRQLAEVAEQHQGMTRRQAWARAVDRLRAVRIAGPGRRASQFPHELSGGMRQRAMIGMAVMGSPALIIADEPTSALDVTVQRQVLRLLDGIRSAEALALLLISHDITVVRQVCDRVLVMYAGRVVEELPAAELAGLARHPYTRALLAAVPDMASDRNQPLAVVPGRPAHPANLPDGCAFAPRCPLADAHCASYDPPLVTDADGRRVACWHADLVAAHPELAVGERPHESGVQPEPAIGVGDPQ